VVSRYLRQVDDDLLRAHVQHGPVDRALCDGQIARQGSQGGGNE
jgi:hypothetical protein